MRLRFPTLLKNPASWMKAEGPDNDIVVSSRVRLARNLRDLPFPGWARKTQRAEILSEIQPSIESLPEMKVAFSADLADLTKLQKQVLVERHLISLEHAARSSGCAAVINKPQTLSIMINEEDHLRMQGIRPGLDLQNAWFQVNQADTHLEEVLDYAFDTQLGYLTACPTNLGTGMRASAMLHLPALVIREEMAPTIKVANKMGLAVRGIYGEGSEALGHLFQISNQQTLGESEEEILARLNKFLQTAVESERNARHTLMKRSRIQMLDQVSRAHAILSHAWLLNSKEALNMLSILRLATSIDLMDPSMRGKIDLLMLEIQPAHLQQNVKKELTILERDEIRAQTLREQLRILSAPAIVSLTTGDSKAASSESHDE